MNENKQPLRLESERDYTLTEAMLGNYPAMIELVRQAFALNPPYDRYVMLGKFANIRLKDATLSRYLDKIDEPIQLIGMALNIIDVQIESDTLVYTVGIKRVH